MKKSNFIFYCIELAVRRGRRRELGGGGEGPYPLSRTNFGTFHASRGL